MMRYAVATVLVGLLTLTTAPVVHAAADDVKSGPQPGEAIPGPFHFLNVNGPHASNPHCLVCEFGLRPAVLIFARTPPTDKGPLGDLLHKLDEAVDRHKNAELRSGLIVLSDDFTKEDARKQLVRRLEGSTKDLKRVLVAMNPVAAHAVLREELLRQEGLEP